MEPLLESIKTLKVNKESGRLRKLKKKNMKDNADLSHKFPETADIKEFVTLNIW